jgi:putative heavy-metal-binding protein
MVSCYLSTCPQSHRRPRDAVRERWAHLVSEWSPVWAVLVDDRPAIVAPAAGRLLVAAAGRTDHTIGFDQVTDVSAVRSVVHVMDRGGNRYDFAFSDGGDAVRAAKLIDQMRAVAGGRRTGEALVAPDQQPDGLLARPTNGQPLVRGRVVRWVDDDDLDDDLDLDLDGWEPPVAAVPAPVAAPARAEAPVEDRAGTDDDVEPDDDVESDHDRELDRQLERELGLDDDLEPDPRVEPGVPPAVEPAVEPGPGAGPAAGSGTAEVPADPVDEEAGDLADVDPVELADPGEPPVALRAAAEPVAPGAADEDARVPDPPGPGAGPRGEEDDMEIADYPPVRDDVQFGLLPIEREVAMALAAGRLPSELPPPGRGPAPEPAAPGVEQQFSIPAQAQAPADESVLLVTTEVVPGRSVARVHGDVLAVVPWSAPEPSGRGAHDAARERLAQAALRRGGDAVVGLRYGAAGAAGGDVIAYGTAVTLAPAQPAAAGAAAADPVPAAAGERAAGEG